MARKRIGVQVSDEDLKRLEELRQRYPIPRPSLSAIAKHVFAVGLDHVMEGERAQEGKGKKRG